MLAMATREGYVRSSVSGLARTANVPKDDAIRALEILSSPDAESGSPEFEGRRIEEIEGGWLLLNYTKYRELRTEQDVYNAAKQKRYRDKQKVGNALPTLPEVTERYGNSASVSASVSDSLRKKEKKEYEREFAEKFWPEYPRRAGNNPKASARDLFVALRYSGVELCVLLDGVTRYRKYCESADAIGTKFVLMAQTWLGKKTEGWTQEWTPAQQTISRDDEEELALRAAEI
jgi:hypothetical protein